MDVPIIEKEDEQEGTDTTTETLINNNNGPVKTPKEKDVELIKSKPSLKQNLNNCIVECSSLPCSPHCQRLCKRNVCKSKCVIEPPTCTRKC